MKGKRLGAARSDAPTRFPPVRPAVLLPVLAALLIVERLWFGWTRSRCAAMLDPETSILIEIGDRMIRGEFPYREFSPIYGPLLYLTDSASYRLGGATWFAALFITNGVALAIGLGFAWMTAAVALRRPFFQCLFLLSSWFLSLDCSGYRVWLPVYAVCIVGLFAASGKLLPLAAGCVLAGLSVLVSPETGIFACLACLVLIAGRRRLPGAAANPWVWGIGCMLLPVLLAVCMAPDVVFAYARNTLGLLHVTNWYAGLPFPGVRISLTTVVFYGPFVFLAGAGLVMGYRLLRDRRRPWGSVDALDPALLVFGAGLLRSVLGRSDFPHLLFALPPAMLLAFRVCERRGRIGAWLILALVAPWAAANIADGLFSAIGVPPGSIAHLRPVALPNEGIMVPSTLARRIEGIVGYVHGCVPEGGEVLSLPLPLYPHLARRRSALPVCWPEHLRTWRGLSGETVARLEESQVPLVLIDQRYLYPQGPPPFDVAVRGPLPWNLTWPMPAGESITRDLRDYLRRNFRYDRTINGVLCYRRKPGAPSLRAETTMSVGDPRADRVARLATGTPVEVPLPMWRADQLRFSVACRYPWGLASLAKTIVRVTLRYPGGATREFDLAVPPADLGLDLRVPLERGTPERATFGVLVPGGFNPRPTSVSLQGIGLVRL